LMYVEGMFCRLPIISYDHGGQTDFLEDGKTGYLIPLNDQEAFKERLEWLIHDSELRETMGEYNLALSKRLTVRQCASRYEQLFADMTSAKTSSCALTDRHTAAAMTDPRRRKESKPTLAGAIDR
jgi:glycosyltransferase involved in cell wall biosynthesis